MAETGLFAQQKMAEYESRLQDAADRLAKEERNSARLADLLRSAKDDAGRVAKERDDLLEGRNTLEARLARAEAIVARSAAQEKAANAADKRAADAEKTLKLTGTELVKTRRDLIDARARIDELAEYSQRLEGEIGPFRVLIAALKAKADAEAQIVAESAKL